MGLDEQEQALTAPKQAVSACWAELALRAKADEKHAFSHELTAFPRLSKPDNHPREKDEEEHAKSQRLPVYC
jgi:hypothetical protein